MKVNVMQFVTHSARVASVIYCDTKTHDLNCIYTCTCIYLQYFSNECTQA